MTEVWRRPITGRWHMLRHDGVHFPGDGTDHWMSTCSPAHCGEPMLPLEPLRRSLLRWTHGRVFVASYYVRRWLGLI